MNEQTKGIYAVEWSPKGSLTVTNLDQAIEFNRVAFEEYWKTGKPREWYIVALANSSGLAMAEKLKLEQIMREGKRKRLVAHTGDLLAEPPAQVPEA